MIDATREELDFGIYPVEIRERSGLFYLICRTFNIVESADTIDQAYIKLAAKRKQAFQDLSSFGVDITSGSEKYSKKIHQSTLQKWMQISVIFMCLGMPIGLLSAMVLVTSKASGIVASVKNNMKSKVSSVINNPAQLTALLNEIVIKLDNVTPERRDELLLSIRKIVLFAKPYVSELQELSDSRRE